MDHQQRASRFAAFIVVPILLLPSVRVSASAYFIGVDELKATLGSKNLVILDARVKKSEYMAGHIPGALHVAWERFATTDGPPGRHWGVLLPEDQLAQAIGKLGIRKKSRVVVYIDPVTGWGEDGRFLWMLRMVDVENSQILDGGIRAWKARGYPVTREVPGPAPADFSISALKTDLLADTRWILDHQKTAKIVDSRQKKEFDGAVLNGEARGGHLPGAIHLHFKSVLKPDGTLKGKKAIHALFQRAGLKKTDEIVVYCTAGIRSAHLTMVMRMLGYTRARNYDASFYHWAADPSLELR